MIGGDCVLPKVLSMSEQKSLPAVRTLLAGKIISNYGQSSIDCVIRRISERGAKLTTQSPLGIPTLFHLLIPGEGPPPVQADLAVRRGTRSRVRDRGLRRRSVMQPGN